jgi:hypothetical protein
MQQPPGWLVTMRDRPSTDPEVRRPGTLEIEKDPALQARFWRIQRIGWVVIAVLIVAAMGGMFAGGPLSWAAASDPGNRLRVEYERFMRQDASYRLRVLIAPHTGRVVDLHIGSAFLDAVRIEDIAPQPRSHAVAGDGHVLRFRTAGEEAEPAAVTLTVQPERVGIVSGAIGIAGEPPAQFTQFVYP